MEALVALFSGSLIAGIILVFAFLYIFGKPLKEGANTLIDLFSFGCKSAKKKIILIDKTADAALYGVQCNALAWSAKQEKESEDSFTAIGTTREAFQKKLEASTLDLLSQVEEKEEPQATKKATTKKSAKSTKANKADKS